MLLPPSSSQPRASGVRRWIVPGTPPGRTRRFIIHALSLCFVVPRTLGVHGRAEVKYNARAPEGGRRAGDARLSAHGRRPVCGGRGGRHRFGRAAGALRTPRRLWAVLIRLLCRRLPHRLVQHLSHNTNHTRPRSLSPRLRRASSVLRSNYWGAITVRSGSIRTWINRKWMNAERRSCRPGLSLDAENIGQPMNRAS